MLISSSIRFFLCSNYLQRPFLSSLKLWLRYLSQKPRYGGFKCWFEGLFSQFYSDYEKYVSNATVLISSSIRLFSSSNYFQRPFLSSLKLWFRYLSQKPRYGGFNCWFEGLFSQFFSHYEKYVSNATVLISSSIRFFLCSNYFERPFLSSLKLWFRYLSQKPRYGGFKCWFEGVFSQFFSHYEKYVSNATVLISSSIRLFFCSNYLQRPFLSSLKLWFRYLSQKPRYGGFKCWFEGLFSQFYSDYEKYVSNATVLISRSISLFLSSNYFQRPFLSSLKLWFRYLSQKPRYGGFNCWFEGLFSQFFSHYEKYVSNATVLISSSIRLFFCSNYLQR